MISRRIIVIIEFLKVLLFGIVEGITEWLPVSSTGHLILLDEFLRLDVASSLGREFAEEFMEMFEVVIQLGAIFAVIVVFFGKLYPFSKGKSTEEKRATWSLWAKGAVASSPAAFAGLVIDSILENKTGKDIDGWLYNAYVVAAALIIYGVLFIVVERVNKKRSVELVELSDISYKKALAIGVFQMLAIIPGTSRSGSTILGAMCLGLSRSVAAEFSFFMAIPAMLGASGIKLLGFFKYLFEASVAVPAYVWLAVMFGMAVSFAVSMATIKFLMDFVKKHGFSSFGVYRIILGAVVLLYFLVR